MSDINEALEILELTLIPGSSPPVYAVGLVASRITFADQQRRAINIVWALLREGRVHSGDHIAVVGAGVAGTTAATYAIRQGVRVTVFEKYDAPFSIQQGSGRWVHPNIYDWPKVGWRDGETKMPCMNWSAGTAGDVVAQLRRQWDAASRDPLLQLVPRTNVVSFPPHAGTGGFVQDSSGNIHGPYRCIIMAAGFGEEPIRPAIDGRPYWRDDDLHQRFRNGGTAFVSGCGDGGLIDIARIALHDFRHDWLADVAADAASDEHLVQELIRIEHDSPSYQDGEALTKATLRIATPPKVVASIQERLRPNTNIILNGRSDGALTRGACMLNRFLVSQLIRLGVVTYMAGKLAPNSVQQLADKFRFELNGSPVEVDLLVIRHGPAKRPLSDFPPFDLALTPVREFLTNYSAGVDRTRRRLWTLLPKEPPSAAGTLPHFTSETLEYLGQCIQGIIQQGLIRLEKLGTVEYKCLESGLLFQIQENAKTHSIHINFPTETHLAINCQRASGEKHNQPFALVTSALTDAAATANVLTAQVPRLVEWLMEDNT